MDKAERDAALRTLRFLCEGTRLEGLTFYGLRLLLSESDNNSKRIDGQIYINIESPICLFKSMPKNIPVFNELPKMESIESLKIICELRLKQIVDVSLSIESPHLFLTFETGEVLFIWGQHDQYESWQVGVSDTAIGDEHWEVVACPNDSLAIWGADDIVRYT
ncbi:hypothetical protein ACIQ2D_15345 [Lysinibacillus sp. NPDC097287]|uniref:hypothetical protein n=1 Tax=Lysinibacillus sp. NPDC097287 TaxID=3364144 RepID=UPI0037F17E75